MVRYCPTVKVKLQEITVGECRREENTQRVSQHVTNRASQQLLRPCWRHLVSSRHGGCTESPWQRFGSALT